MNWNTAGEKADELSQGTIIKMKGGQDIEGVFRGDPVMDRKHFIDQKPNECIGLPNCPLCAAGHKASVKFYLNMAVKTSSGYSMRVMGFSPGKFTQLNSIRSKIKTPFERTSFSVSREGEGLDTDYIIIPQGECPDMVEVESLPIFDLPTVIDRPKDQDRDSRTPF